MIMNYSEIVAAFDNKISTYISEIESSIEGISFDAATSICFTISDEFDSKSLFQKPKQQGVYLFELNLDNPKLVGTKRATKIKNFSDSWAKKKNDSFFSSSVIKKRLVLRKDFNEQWLPIYIGKNKDIHKRIIEHIDLSPKKNTYAMKLKHRTNLHGLEFRVSIIAFDVANYDFIIPHIERTLRDKYIPIIGKQ